MPPLFSPIRLTARAKANPNRTLATLSHSSHHRLQPQYQDRHQTTSPTTITPRHILVAKPLPYPTSPPSRSAHFQTGPSPPRLPKEEQDLFDTLQRQSTGAFSTPQPSRNTPAIAGEQSRIDPLLQINQSPHSRTSEVAGVAAVVATRADQQQRDPSQDLQAKPDPVPEAVMTERVIEARGKGEELHPNVRRGAHPEFEGDVNPKTGEVGGPKNEPLRWGSGGEWSYNGRTTDF